LCEYCKVPKSKEHRTKLLVVQNIQFFRNHRNLPNDSLTLHLADSISITFEFQKNNKRDVTITMHWTGDAAMCPVIAWASII